MPGSIPQTVERVLKRLEREWKGVEQAAEIEAKGLRYT
jgi:hypothetical protein